MSLAIFDSYIHEKNPANCRKWKVLRTMFHKNTFVSWFQLMSLPYYFRFSSSHSASSGGGRASVSSEGVDPHDEDDPTHRSSFSNASSPAAAAAAAGNGGEKGGNFVSFDLVWGKNESLFFH